MSNWEKRPLTLAQMHYGALDAYCMLPLLQKIIEKGSEDSKFELKKYINEQSLLQNGKKEVEAKKPGKKNHKTDQKWVKKDKNGLDEE